MTSSAPKPWGAAQHRQLCRAFAAIWLLYDVIDVAFGGTQSLYEGAGARSASGLMLLAQAVLIVAQSAVVADLAPAAAMAVAGLARGVEGCCFSLNDFWYAALWATLLAALPPVAVSRRLLLLQSGWIYLATGILKLNADWLSGGDLYVRQNLLLAAHRWPYPGPYLTCVRSLTCNGWLAWLGVICELTLAVLLLCCARRPHRLAARGAMVLCGGIHLFAALATNVWFFGASIVAQVVLLLRPGPMAPSERGS